MTGTDHDGVVFIHVFLRPIYGKSSSGRAGKFTSVRVTQWASGDKRFECI